VTRGEIVAGISLSPSYYLAVIHCNEEMADWEDSRGMGAGGRNDR